MTFDKVNNSLQYGEMKIGLDVRSLFLYGQRGSQSSKSTKRTLKLDDNFYNLSEYHVICFVIICFSFFYHNVKGWPTECIVMEREQGEVTHNSSFKM